MNDSTVKKKGRGWLWLLIIPFIATLFPGFYSFSRPELWGFPFFYWYQLLWVIIAALITWFVYTVTK